MSIVTKRRSVRKYDLTKKIPDEVLISLCKAAEEAPTARRQDSREYVIINDQDIINEIALGYKCTMIIKDCNTMIAVIGKDPNNLPAKDFQVIDLSCAVENILIEATTLGLGSVIIGTYPKDEKVLRANEILNIHDGRFVFAFICLGYPLEKDCFFESGKGEKAKISFNRG